MWVLTKKALIEKTVLLGLQAEKVNGIKDSTYIHESIVDINDILFSG